MTDPWTDPYLNTDVSHYKPPPKHIVNNDVFRVFLDGDPRGVAEVQAEVEHAEADIRDAISSLVRDRILEPLGDGLWVKR